MIIFLCVEIVQKCHFLRNGCTEFGAFVLQQVLCEPQTLYCRYLWHALMVRIKKTRILVRSTRSEAFRTIQYLIPAGSENVRMVRKLQNCRKQGAWPFLKAVMSRK